MNGKNEAIQALWTYVVLVGLLLIALGLRFLHLGIVEPSLLLVIAGIQAVLVLLFFMRVRDSTKLIWLFAGGGFLWLSILLIIVLSDYISRPWWR